MSLANRFSTLLLATLGLILVGFSTALFVSTRVYLNRQVDDRLTAILTLLSTCVDVAPGWVRWEPREKRLPPSHWNERPATAWLVYDGSGIRLMRPRHLPEEQLTPAWVPAAATGVLPDRLTDRKGRAWRVAQRRVRPTLSPVPASERPQDTPDKTYHDEVLLAAFVSLEETEAALGTLAWFLVSISTLTWVLAALSARWLSRRTLVPLTRLVESARNLDATNPGWSLADVGAGDELDDMRHAFNDLLSRLHVAYERQRRFSSEASHQLRTPVAIIAGHLEVALRSDRTPEEYRRIVQLAHRRAVDLGKIVESLLFLSRAGAAMLPQLESTELRAWLLEFLESRAECPRSGDIVIRQVDGDALWVRAQPHLLGQLLVNLLDNACKYSPPGSRVEIALAKDGGFALLSVEDFGCGIAHEDFARIFEPFYRASQSTPERVVGVGLGLSVVKRIADAFGGTVIVQSTVGEGSRFEVWLPLSVPSNREAGEPLGRNPLLSERSPRGAA
jgi:signal transduction histidine kinase